MIIIFLNKEKSIFMFRKNHGQNDIEKNNKIQNISKKLFYTFFNIHELWLYVQFRFHFFKIQRVDRFLMGIEKR